MSQLRHCFATHREDRFPLSSFEISKNRPLSGAHPSPPSPGFERQKGFAGCKMFNIEINSKGESLQTFLNTGNSGATKLSHLPTIFLLTGFYWDGRTASESLNREVLPPVSAREGNRLGWQTGAVHLHLYRMVSGRYLREGAGWRAVSSGNQPRKQMFVTDCLPFGAVVISR